MIRERDFVIGIKVPKKYQDKVHTIKRFHNTNEYTKRRHNCSFIYIAYLNQDYWEHRFNSYSKRFEWVDSIGATSLAELFRQIERVEKVDSSK